MYFHPLQLIDLRVTEASPSTQTEVEEILL